MTDSPSSDPSSEFAGLEPRGDVKTRIVDALMKLAGERRWEDISISEIALRADVKLSQFRDAFPSKGAVLAAFSRRMDKIVLQGAGDELLGEPVKERLFDVLMRRLDAMAPYKLGIETILDWARRDPLAAAALNRSMLNSMRFMLEAAGVGSEGAFGALKLQGLVIAWGRLLDIWLRDDDPSLSRTMAAMDKELTRGASLVARVEDVDRLVAPLRSMASTFFDRRARSTESSGRRRRRWRDDGDDQGSSAAI